MLCLYFCTCRVYPDTHTNTLIHTCLSLFAVCFTIIANTPLPSVHFTHDMAHLFTHLSELLCVSVCVCVCVHVYVCIVSCHARLERCWSAGQANGIWPCPGVLWHVGMRDSKLNGQELLHMAVRILTCQHCICNSSSGLLSTHFSLSLPPRCLTNRYDQCQHRSHISVQSVGGVGCWQCKWGLLDFLGLHKFILPSPPIRWAAQYQPRQIQALLCFFPLF